MKKLLIGALFAAFVGLTPHGAAAIPLAAPAGLARAAATPDVEQVHWRRYRHCHRRYHRCHGGRWYRRGYGWGPGFYFGFGPWGPRFAFPWW